MDEADVLHTDPRTLLLEWEPCWRGWARARITARARARAELAKAGYEPRLEGD